MIWKSVLELALQGLAWSALPPPVFMWHCSHNYLKWLYELDTGKHNSPADWEDYMRRWKMLDT